MPNRNEPRSNRRTLLKSIGTFSTFGLGLGALSQPGAAAFGTCDFNRTKTIWDCNSGGTVVQPVYYSGHHIAMGSKSLNSGYLHCFMMTNIRTGRSARNERVSDLSSVEVYGASKSGVNGYSVTHRGASPGKHRHANGPSFPQSKLINIARGKIENRTNPAPRSAEWHRNNYEGGSSKIKTGIMFDYLKGDGEVADHAHQVILQMKTNNNSKFSILDWGNHAIGGATGVQCNVKTSGASMNVNINPYAGRKC